MTTPLKKIVIVGGGAGGLELATQLGRKLGRHKKAKITLVDRNHSHLWKPLLHEVATGSLDEGVDALSYLAHARNHGFQFQLGSVVDINREGKTITLGELRNEKGELLVAERKLPYDTLVMALGSTSNDFNTPGVKENCIFLDNPHQARRFHQEMLNLFLKYSANLGANGKVNIAIVGGGATGVELAVELREASHVVSAYSLSAFNPRLDLAITLIEGAPRILAALPERISKAAQDRLESLDIRVETGCAVASVTEDHVTTRDGRRFHADMCLWAAGISAPDLLQKLELPLHRNGQVMVDEQLRTPDPDIYAMGDCAAAPWTEGRLVPARAQAAHQQASYLARQLGARLKGEAPEDKPYVYEDHGSLVSLGQDAGVGSLMGKLTGRGLFLSGMLARMMYMSLHLMHHRAILGVSRTASLALARLLVRRTHSRVKLH